MRSFTIFFLLCLASPVLAGSEYAAVQHPHWKRSYAPRSDRIRVVDGDTLSYSNRPERQEEVVYRLYGIDAPEDEGCGAAQGRAAKAELKKFLAGGRVLIQAAREKDKYGRDLARVRVGGQDAAQHLISLGLAHAYFGGTKTPWC